MIEEYLKVRDGRGAWQAFAKMLMKEGAATAHKELRKTVCEHYWWLSGELYDLEGDLGWSAGFHSWEGDSYFPIPQPNPAARLHRFIDCLAELPFSSSVSHLKQLYRSKVNPKALEPRMIQFLFTKFPGHPEEAVAFAYNRIATVRSEYELGAARPFLRLSLDDGLHLSALAGLVMILCRGLSQLTVRADMVKLVRFGRGQSFYLAADVPDYTESLQINE
jgi:hypothetical protein